MSTATSVLSKPATGFYLAELDALRLFAFLCVYFCHAVPEAWTRVPLIAGIKDAGNFGVCLFFFLSAYLITELLCREQAQFGRVHVRAFYLRRVLRIWPLYYGITAGYAIGGLFLHSLRMETGRIAAYFLMAGNWYIALHPWVRTPLRALWSISVEEQFYLVWPVLGRLGNRSAYGAASLVLLPISWMTVLLVSGGPFAYNTVWLNSLVQFQYFACGALLALALQGRTPEWRPKMRLALALAGLVAWWTAAFAFRIKRPQAHPSALQFLFGYMLVEVGCLCLFLAVLEAGRWLFPRWVLFLGRISFGLYMFHETAFLLVDEAQKRLTHGETAWLLVVNKTAALALTIGLASASYRFYEAPFLRFKRRHAFVRSGNR
ncbi:MAG: acyltransferase [Bacillota bacterium]|nr:acyltransferase [Bacillota bacterium]